MMSRLTKADRETIRVALNYAIVERDGLAEAYSRVGPEADRAAALVARFEALHVKMFGEPSHEARFREECASMPVVSIATLMSGDDRD